MGCCGSRGSRTISGSRRYSGDSEHPTQRAGRRPRPLAGRPARHALRARPRPPRRRPAPGRRPSPALHQRAGAHAGQRGLPGGGVGVAVQRRPTAAADHAQPRHPLPGPGRALPRSARLHALAGAHRDPGREASLPGPRRALSGSGDAGDPLDAGASRSAAAAAAALSARRTAHPLRAAAEVLPSSPRRPPPARLRGGAGAHRHPAGARRDRGGAVGEGSLRLRPAGATA